MEQNQSPVRLCIGYLLPRNKSPPRWRLETAHIISQFLCRWSVATTQWGPCLESQQAAVKISAAKSSCGGFQGECACKFTRGLAESISFSDEGLRGSPLLLMPTEGHPRLLPTCISSARRRQPASQGSLHSTTASKCNHRSDIPSPRLHHVGESKSQALWGRDCPRAQTSARGDHR